MARPVWRGAISFGLVNVPVKAYPAVRSHDVHFHQIDKRTGSRIRIRKVSAETGEEVAPDDIALGFEVGEGRYVRFDKGELEELRPASTRTIEVTDFVALDQIDPIYYERPYWLAPDGQVVGQAYQLLRAAMEDLGRVAIGSVVMRDRQYVAAIRPLDGALAMSTLRFADEVVPRSEVEDIPDQPAEPDPKLLAMATQIIDSLTTDWDRLPLPRHLHRRAARAHQGQGGRRGDHRARRGRRAQGRRPHAGPRSQRGEHPGKEGATTQVPHKGPGQCLTRDSA